ncbi:ROK family protein [Microbacterium betulae]|uniref:ROK family protein n=1 Tax=Microbacterium betulae TaxID=2981139 RepID=A0AA97FKF6_9MICO|nr:ROK family protein [Microbacterium sp. AB]
MRIGLDMGGTKTDAVALDRDGRIAARARIATEHGADGAVATALRALEALDRGGAARRPASIGIGVPGQIDGGRVRHAVNLRVTDLDLGGEVERATGIPVRVENDVKAAALGASALRRGARADALSEGASRAADADVIAYLNLGTGTAAGIVAAGRLWRGAGGAAGEIGHLSIDPAGPVCVCGQRGCIETYTGGAAIARRWGRGGELPVRDVFDAADAADPHAVALRDGLARGVAAAVRLLVLAVDARTIVIGGGLAALGDRLLAVVNAELIPSGAASPFIRSLRLAERIELLPPASAAAAVGASLVGRGEPVASSPTLRT